MNTKTKTDNAQQATPEATPAKETNRAGKEAAKYRTQLREAEAERDLLRGQLRALQTQVIEADLPAPLKPEAWRLAVPDIDGLLNDDGTINWKATKAAQADAAATLGIDLSGASAFARIGDTPTPKGSTGGFADAFRPGPRE